MATAPEVRIDQQCCAYLVSVVDNPLISDDDDEEEEEVVEEEEVEE